MQVSVCRELALSSSRAGEAISLWPSSPLTRAPLAELLPLDDTTVKHTLAGGAIVAADVGALEVSPSSSDLGG